jgi:Domain of Unknown Function (DUF1080)
MRQSTLLSPLFCALVFVACGGPEKPVAAPAPAESPPAVGAPAPSALAAAAPAVSAAPAAATAPPPAAPPKDPVALFNGKDLTGFVQVLDSKWVVEKGVLLARQDPKGRRQGESWLITEKDYIDFILTLKYRVTKGGNSGVFLRDPVSRADRLAAPDGGPAPWEIGLEANIQDSPKTDWPTGSIYSIGTAAVHDLDHPGDWNDMKIKVQGEQVSVWLNDKLAVDVKQTRTKKGGIGFQRHGTPEYKDKLVELKDIVIQEL